MNEKRQFLENPITTEIVRNALLSAADEMNESLARSAFSPIIYEMKDCSVCLFNEKVELLGQSAGLPIFLGNLDACINATTEQIGGVEQYREGDLYILNDSYIGGTHLNDVTTFSPIFHEGKLVGFTATRAHWLDIGSKDPGYPMDATSIYQEGIRIPPTKIYEDGKPIQNIIRLITENNRFSDAALGDLNAQVAASRTGEKRYKELINRFGLETINKCVHDIFLQSEDMDNQVVKAIPDGVYKAEGCLDNDGVSDKSIPIKVKITIDGDQFKIDLTGSSEQQVGQTNCGFAQTISACRVAFKDLISPDSPVTGGNFKNFEVIAPEGTIFHAVEPAPCGWYFTPLGILIDLIIEALSPVMKDKAAAAHYGDSMVVTFSGTDAENNEFLSVEATAGGWGAFHNGDGPSALINHVSGDFKNLPVEVFEANYPIAINRYELRKNSGGKGEYRGGLGVVREYEILGDKTSVSTWFERSKTPAWGLFGGESGSKPDVEVHSPDGNSDHFLKTNGRKLQKGDVVTVKTGGGGGFGNYSERIDQNIENDMKNEYTDEQ